jgi:hypothetical protein
MPCVLRVHLASDLELCRAVVSAFLAAVFASYRRRARAQDLLRSPRSFTHPGAINFVQRFGSSLAANVHFHAVVLDGVYLTHGPASRPEFHCAPPLDDAQAGKRRAPCSSVKRARKVSRCARSTGCKTPRDGSRRATSRRSSWSAP